MRYILCKLHDVWMATSSVTSNVRFYCSEYYCQNQLQRNVWYFAWIISLCWLMLDASYRQSRQHMRYFIYGVWSIITWRIIEPRFINGSQQAGTSSHLITIEKTDRQSSYHFCHQFLQHIITYLDIVVFHRAMYNHLHRRHNVLYLLQALCKFYKTGQHQLLYQQSCNLSKNKRDLIKIT